MRPDVERNEAHVVNAPNGHHLSTDCWCEPTSIRWVMNSHGVKVLVVDHRDETLAHRVEVLAQREADRAAPYANLSLNEPWITRVLDPRLLPPHDPNERSLS